MNLRLPSNLKLALVAEPVGEHTGDGPLPTDFLYLSHQDGEYIVTSDKSIAVKFDRHRQVLKALEIMNKANGSNYRCYLYKKDFNKESSNFDLELDTLNEL